MNSISNTKLTLWRENWKRQCSHPTCSNFSSALSHCGGANGTGKYVDRVFAYLVSNPVGYLYGTIEIDHENDDRRMMEVGEGGGKGTVGVLQQTKVRKRGRELKAPKRYDQE
jgi:hypothetical protein